MMKIYGELLYMRNAYVFLITLITVGIAMFVLFTVRAINTEIYCTDKADKLSANVSALLVSPTYEERQDIRLKYSDLITPYFREFLKCKREQKLFF